jgi:hypothetical protein
LVPAAPTPPVAPVPAALPAALDAGAVAAPEAGVDVAPAADPGGARAPTKRVTKRRPTGGGPVLVEDDF